MTDLIKRLDHFEQGGTVENPKALIREAIAEIKKLRAGGAWNEHVQYQLAMKRQRDGECICNTGPDTDGPDEFYPWHGRRYTELVDIIVGQQAQLNGLSAATQETP
jgi:hypothetical protein